MKNFHDLVHELGELMDIELKVDLNQACRIEINQSIKVQLELDSPGETILLMTLITELPPGKFRENILKDGLKANFLAEEKEGVLSYVERENSLVLCHTLYTHSITANILFDHLLLFVDRAKKWHDAIEGGRTAPALGEIPEETQKKGSIFGLK